MGGARRVMDFVGVGVCFIISFFVCVAVRVTLYVSESDDG